MQRARDTAAGLNTKGFISGYRGSPLGMVDLAVWKAGERFTEAGIRFLPAINEELAATAVLGTQRVESDPERTVEGGLQPQRVTAIAVVYTPMPKNAEWPNEIWPV